jgi:hypothetical protein
VANQAAMGGQYEKTVRRSVQGEGVKYKIFMLRGCLPQARLRVNLF